VSEQPESPATPAADEPAALVPDDATAVHPTGGEPTGSEPMPDPVAPEPVASVTPAAEPPVWTPPAPPQDTAGPSGGAAVTADRPEVAVGAAFAGGLVLALILKRLAR